MQEWTLLLKIKNKIKNFHIFFTFKNHSKKMYQCATSLLTLKPFAKFKLKWEEIYHQSSSKNIKFYHLGTNLFCHLRIRHKIEIRCQCHDFHILIQQRTNCRKRHSLILVQNNIFKWFYWYNDKKPCLKNILKYYHICFQDFKINAEKQITTQQLIICYDW